MKSHVIAAAASLMLGACATLPDATLSPSSTLTEIYRDRRVQLFAAPGVDSAGLTGLTLGSVTLGAANPAASRAEIEGSIRAAMQAALERSTAGQPGAAAGAGRGVRLDVTLSDIRLVDPFLNVLSTATMFVPVDRGAMTITARYVAPDGETIVLRRERLTGRGFGLGTAFFHRHAASGGGGALGRGLRQLAGLRAAAGHCAGGVSDVATGVSCGRRGRADGVRLRRCRRSERGLRRVYCGIAGAAAA
ncbi:hypothetical protein [Pseudodonghicola flavimaris]|uniref:hypothetical protein n=1 Tax=Pseudodonghicola flavimaris TaxID=3050036 RepID=UPI00389AD698